MKKLTPFKGMDNVSHDDEMEAKGDTRFIRLRDAVNVDVSQSGRISMRRTGKSVSDIPYKSVWQSSLHGDVFGVVDLHLVRINVADWSYEILGEVRSEKINYEIINNLVYLCDGFELYAFDGELLQKLTIDTPPPVLCEQREPGALKQGKYTVAITWEVKGKESALSSLFSIDVGEHSSIEVMLPYCFDPTVDMVNVYCTSRDGTDLRKYDSFSITERLVNISNTESLGRSIQFKNLSSMKAGKFLGYWQGRLITAERNIIRFSQALNFHLFDERYDYISMPQRITFMNPVDGGIWVGQVDHVVFLSGEQPQNLNFIKKTAQAPVPFSAIYLDNEDLAEIAQGGRVVTWLSQHGYVIGGPSGALIEPQAKRLKGIVAKSGQSVRFDQRLITIAK